MSIAMRGLKLKPNYEGLINVAASDKLYSVKFPHRDASFLRKWVCNVTIGWRRDEDDGKTTRHGK